MSQDQQLLDALTALKNGDFSVRLSTDQEGTAKEIAETFNTMMEQLNALSSELLRIMRELAPEGRFGGQAEVEGLSGTWRQLKDTMNMTAGILTLQFRDTAHCIHTLANDKPVYAPTMAPVAGETADLKDELYRLIERFGTFTEKA
jgi:methyl-accepting chemotaxis protein